MTGIVRAVLPAMAALCFACDGGSDAPADAAPSSDATEDAIEDAAPPDPIAVAFEPLDVADAPLAWGMVIAWLDDTRAVVFGGTDATDTDGTTLDRTWLFDASTSQPTWTAIDASGPGPRYCACAAYDSTRDRVVMMGGRTLDAPLSIAPETWELDVSARTWTKVDVETPSSVIGCAMAYAREPGALFLFGGAGRSGTSDRTYRFDPDAPAWVEIAGDAPSQRYDPAFVAMPDGHSLLLFAGALSAMGAGFFSDVWMFDAADESWREVSPDGMGPPGRRTPWLVLDADRGFWLAFGFDGEMKPMGDAWYFDLASATFSEWSLEGGPTARGFSPALPGGADSLGFAIGGYDGVGPAPDAWRLVRTAP